jgi:plastocyanin
MKRVFVFLMLSYVILASGLLVCVSAEEQVIDHKENFKVGDCWWSAKYTNLPAGRVIHVSWKADLGVPFAMAVGTIFLIKESELTYFQTHELKPWQCSHALIWADLEDDVGGYFSFVLPETGNYYVWIENYAWSRYDILGTYITVNYYTVKLLDTTPPEIFIISPQNTTYTISSIPLTFTINEPVSWIGYSLDENANVTITANVTLTGLAGGSHSVIVYAQDTSGNMGVSNKVYFTVRIPKQPNANFIWSPYLPTVGETVTFDASSSTPDGGTIINYQWDFGDGNYADGITVTHVYNNPGIYTVTLNVTDSEGLWDVEQKQIEVIAPLLVSISPKSAFIIVGQSVSFTSLVSGGYPPYYYQWYLNNSAVSGASSNTWTFRPLTTGIYMIYLNVTDNSRNVAISETAVVYVAPQLTVSISPTSKSLLVGQSVTFTSTVSGGYPPYSYQWYLNGNFVPEATLDTWTFSPKTSGIFYVYLKVTDSKGNTAQSETARVEVTTVPVGGYSIPIDLNTKAEPSTPYILLLAILTIVFTAVKRKTKRK